MDVLSDQQWISHTKRWYGYEKETLGEKLNLF